MVAIDDIAKDECIFEIPRRLLLRSENCGIAHVLSRGKSLSSISSLYADRVRS